MRYRRSIYRKNGIHIYLLIALCVVFAVVLLFVIVGNALGNKIEESEERRSSAKATETKATEHPIPKSVNACHVPLSADGSRLDDRLKKASSNGYDSVCFELDTEDDTLLYWSDVALSMGYLSSDSKLWNLTDAMELFDSNGLYSIGITHLSRMNTDDDLDRSVAAGYYAARTAEAIRAGVDDVLLYPKDMPVERYAELVEIAEEVHRLCDGGTVGIALPVSVLTADNGAEAVDILWSEFDYIAVDVTSGLEEGETVPEKIDRELGSMLYYLLRYNMRVLVPFTDDAELTAEIAAAVSSNGSKNIQIMP